jgi:hypothetical protein
MNIERVKIADLHEDPANARKHGEKNRATVRASLQEFGQVEALVVEAGTGRVLGGNCRLAELRALGVEEAEQDHGLGGHVPRDVEQFGQGVQRFGFGHASHSPPGRTHAAFGASATHPRQ